MKIGRITVSDRASAGVYEDRSGRRLKPRWASISAAQFEAAIVPDEAEIIAAALLRFTDDLKVDLVVTTGGTGISVRDVTPEATRSVLEKELPVLAKAMRMTRWPK